MSLSRTFVATTLIAALCVAAPAFGAPKPRPPKTVACATADQLSQPFLADFGDPFSYVLVSGGSFEQKPWSGGTTAAGNEPWFVRNARDGSSLAIAEGGVAQAKPQCVALTDPTLRFFARDADTAGGALTLRVTYELASGGFSSFTLPVVPAQVDLLTGWFVTTPMPIIANLINPKVVGSDPIEGDPTTNVVFEFVATSGAWQIDDVYLDPYRRT